MALVAKRKLRQTWREAVAVRAGEAAPLRLASCLSAFDALRAGGTGEAEAAHESLAQFGLLWDVDAPGLASPAARVALDS